MVDGQNCYLLASETIEDGIRSAADDEFADVTLGNAVTEMGVKL